MVEYNDPQKNPSLRGYDETLQNRRYCKREYYLPQHSRLVNLNVAPAPLWNYFQSPRSINAQVIALSATGGVFVKKFKLLAWPNRAQTSTRREYQ